MLKDRIQSLLDECRMLLLGAQVLLSFASEAVFQPGFAELSCAGRWACGAGVVALVAAAGTLMWPAAYHRIVHRGRDEASFHRFAGRMLNAGLAPFALGLAAGFYVVAEQTGGVEMGPAAAATVLTVAGGAWFAVPWAARSARAEKKSERHMNERSGSRGGVDVTERIRQVLTEARMVLPGAQALLGFGLIAALTERFDRMPGVLKAVHVGGLCFIGLATVLLMMPAAYHRIAEYGEQTARFHGVAGRLLLGAMAALAPGLAAVVWIVLEVVSGSRVVGVAAAAVTLAALYGGWFGWSLAVRRSRAR